MKLGSLKEGGRDGTLIVVDRAVKKAVRASSVAPTLQKALDDWATAEPKLRALAQQLADGKASGAFDLDTKALAAPLPRAYQWADGSAYVVHVELVRKARGVEMPPSFWTDPLMYQGGSDSFIGPNDDIEARRRSPWHRFRRRDRRDRRRRADGRVARGGAPAHQAGHHPERRVAAQRHRHRAGQGFRLLPRQARHGLRAGRRHARRAGRRLGRRQAQPAADLDASTARNSAIPTPPPISPSISASSSPMPRRRGISRPARSSAPAPSPTATPAPAAPASPSGACARPSTMASL